MDMGTLNNRPGIEAQAPSARTLDMASTAVSSTSGQQSNDRVDEPARQQVLAAVADMQNYVQSTQRNIEFQLDDESGRMVITVTEAGSGEVIRQIPSEEAVRLAESLSHVRSMLFSEEA